MARGPSPSTHIKKLWQSVKSASSQFRPRVMRQKAQVRLSSRSCRRSDRARPWSSRINTWTPSSTASEISRWVYTRDRPASPTATRMAQGTLKPSLASVSRIRLAPRLHPSKPTLTPKVTRVCRSKQDRARRSMEKQGLPSSSRISLHTVKNRRSKGPLAKRRHRSTRFLAVRWVSRSIS